MIMLLLPLFAIDLGLSFTSVGLLFAVRSVGILLASIPAGVAIERYGEKILVLFCLALVVLACVGFSLWHSPLGLVLMTFLFGLGSGGVALARHSFISEKVENRLLGRTMSKLAGLQRLGTLAGPLIAGGMSHWVGFQSAFLFAAGVVLVSLLICLYKLPADRHRVSGRSLTSTVQALPSIFQQHQQVLMTAGVFIMILRLIRGCWPLLLPLWASHIGLNKAEIGFVFGVSSAIDLAVLSVSGQITDRMGRKWVALPCIVFLSLSLLLMPYCLTLTSLIALALLAGSANGLGGGIIMTLGADLAPHKDRGTFLACWRLVGDSSGTVSPLIIAWLASTLSLISAISISGMIGLLGGALMWIGVKETLSTKPDDLSQ
ncbi:MAG: MFS family permease [Arenicella sp.]|jgi:MFS family permease